MSGVLVDLGAVPAATGIVLAQDPAPPPGEGDEFGKAAPVALVIVILLGLAMIVLVRSMSKRIRKLPESFDGPASVHEDESDDETPAAGR